MQLAGLVLGVRANEDSLTGRLRELLGDHIVEEDQTPPNLSLALGQGRHKHQLCRGGAVMLRTASVGRLLRAVPLLLDGYLPPATDVVRLNACVLVGRDAAVLVDRRYTAALERLEPRLARCGYRRFDGYFAEVDPGTGQIVLGPPRLAFAASAAATLEPPGEREFDPTDGWRYPVRSLLALEGESVDGEPRTPGRRLLDLAPLVDQHPRADVRGLRLLAAWLLSGRLEGGPLLDDAGLLAAVTGG